jgi:hypothetical protein
VLNAVFYRCSRNKSLIVALLIDDAVSIAISTKEASAVGAPRRIQIRKRATALTAR